MSQFVGWWFIELPNAQLCNSWPHLCNCSNWLSPSISPLPNPNLVTWSVENLVLCFISYSSHSSSSSPSSCLVFGNKRSSWAGRGIASLQLAQALWTWQRHHCIHFCDHLQWIHVLQICNKLPLLIQVHKARRDVNIYLLPSLYFTYIFYDVHSKLGDSWRFNQGLDSKCFRTGGKPDSP